MNTPPYRLLAIDVDGTLVTTGNEVPEANRAALHRAHQAGVRICLCTGRSLAEARPVLDQIGLDQDAGVFVFGAIVSRLPVGETMHRAAIPAAVAERLVSLFTGMGYPVLTLYDPSQAGTDYRYLPGDRNRRWYEQWLAMAPAKIETIPAWSPIPVEPVRIGVIASPAEIDGTIAALRREFRGDEVTFNSIFAPNYGLHVVECFAAGVNKWSGLQRLTARWEIPREQVAAIGDDVNDLDMIREAGLGIAMGNAIEPIKRIAKWQAPTNVEGGVAGAVEYLMNLGSDAGHGRP